MTIYVDASMAADIRAAVKECSERGLCKAAQWAADLLLTIPEAKRKARLSITETTFSTSTPAKNTGNAKTSFMETPPMKPQVRHPHAASLRSLPPELLQHELQLEALEEDEIAMARAWMDTREYNRIAPALRNCRSSKARFLEVYSRFAHNSSPTELRELLRLICDAADPWLLFLKGLFLKHLGRREEAAESAILSIAGFLWNWSAWELLRSCVSDSEQMSALIQLLPVPENHPLTQMFHIKTMSDLQLASDHEMTLAAKLLEPNCFPRNDFLYGLRGCIMYNSHDMGAAVVEFERMLELDPWHIEYVDVYSFALHVNEGTRKLSRLSREYLLLNKDRPEVACFVGNYYSVRSYHIDAIKYFKRAADLDPTYDTALTLMGHEYIEMKNAQAAITAYRRTLNIRRDDHRAWYGLGQAYELLSMHDNALHYFLHATSIVPYDMRMWQAAGHCYEVLGRIRQAIECYKRSLISANPCEISVKLNLARLYYKLGEDMEATSFHRRIIEISQAEQRDITEYAKSCIEVAAYQMLVPDGDLNLAREYLSSVAASNSEDVARATTMLKKMIRYRLSPEPALNKGAGA
ncbi:TPR-like protein [Guyanagaster necrorhizus]|uniref:TPR-like protein n=1 Tax=Guyanagaster necrorhizus TaxID=856835 RepID=A0A9P8AMN9_9AGAR|nr:TPR-like protein [Guyanagaster necrorhizus MCA 3950]KAG7440032.1 TPR-like protein [Guyanagaster necrorhizus MCA 3950]